MTCPLENNCILKDAIKYRDRYKLALTFFMKECPDCKTLGYVAGYPKRVKCKTCDGIGFLGRKVENE